MTTASNTVPQPPVAFHPDATDQLAYQIINLRLLCQLYHDGMRTLYKAAIVPLRTLLLVSSGCPPLALRLPNPQLPKLLVTNLRNDGIHFTMPCEMKLPGYRGAPGVGLKHVNIAGGSINQIELGSLFKTDLMPLKDWLAQPFLDHPLTLEGFIRHIAHKDGGAHYQDGHPEISRYEDCASLHWPLTAKIGEAVAETLWAQFEAANPGYEVKVP